ncbi:MAG: hypothetical protein CM15mP105_0700 [Methanobacteriota archaeon]|nr:MAG: hypothetical protein CM15mP105_0700 [Euryarchaeota archaeon]
MCYGYTSRWFPRVGKKHVRTDGPETRSAEFFGFFGFFGKVAALLGPLIYGIMTVMFDREWGYSRLHHHPDWDIHDEIFWT